MTVIGSDAARVQSQPPVTQTAKPADGAAPEAAKAPQANQVTLSAEGKALLAALQNIEHESKAAEAANKTIGDDVESFAHGALGMDHPDEFKEEKDVSYSAGQYLSAAATLGGIIALLV